MDSQSIVSEISEPNVIARVEKEKEETEKSNHQRISLPDPVAWSGSSVYMEK